MATLLAVLLDIDGTLVDSNDAHARAWEDALRHFGHDVAFEKLRGLIGKGGDKLLAEAVGIDAESSHGTRRVGACSWKFRCFQQVWAQLAGPRGMT